MKNNILLFVLIISFFNSKGQSNKTTFGLQYKPIIPSKGSHLSNYRKKYESSKKRKGLRLKK